MSPPPSPLPTPGSPGYWGATQVLAARGVYFRAQTCGEALNAAPRGSAASCPPLHPPSRRLSPRRARGQAPPLLHRAGVPWGGRAHYRPRRELIRLTGICLHIQMACLSHLVRLKMTKRLEAVWVLQEMTPGILVYFLIFNIYANFLQSMEVTSG